MKALRVSALSQLLSLALRKRKLLILGVSSTLLGTFFTLFEPRLFGYAIDRVVLPKRWDLLTLFTLIYALVHLMRFVFGVIGEYLFGKLGQEMMQDLRVAVFAKIQSLPIATFERVPAGKLVTRVTYDIASLSEVFSTGLVTLFKNILIVVGILIWLLVLNFRLGLIAASIFPILVWGAVYFTQRLHRAYRETRKRISRLNAHLSETLMGMKTVMIFSQEKTRGQRYSKINDQYAKSQIGTVKIYALFQPMITICSGISMALVLWFGGGMAEAGSIQLGVLSAFFAFAAGLFLPVRDIADKWNVILSGMASAERIFDILKWKSEVKADALTAPAKSLQGIRGHIVFEKVWFAYSGENWVFKDLSLEIKPGEKIGIVGHTGAGKSTIIGLLLRFYEPQKGRILLDGRDLRDLDKRELRLAIGLVQQDVFLFSGSVEENWSLWREAAPGVALAVESMMDEMGLKDRFKVELQEKGSNLSSGEKQCIAFARAMAASPAVWVMDEATSHIDSESEQKMSLWLRRITESKTLILIAHRLATVRATDRILVMNHGVLAEHGTHDELMQRNGIYYRLYQCQEMQEFAEEP